MLARHHEPENHRATEQHRMKRISPNILCRHRPSAPSYRRSIVFREDVIFSRHHDGRGCLGHFSWHIGVAAVDANSRRRKAGPAVSAIVDRDAPEQRDLLWTPGGPFSPSFIEYRISASTGTVSYSIRTPSWLTASSTHGVADTSGVTVTFNVSASASTLRPGTYGPFIVFASGRGSTIRFVRLIVQGPSLPRPADQVERGRGGYLLDGRGGYLLDDRGNRLLAQ